MKKKTLGHLRRGWDRVRHPFGLQDMKQSASLRFHHSHQLANNHPLHVFSLFCVISAGVFYETCGFWVFCDDILPFISKQEMLSKTATMYGAVAVLILLAFVMIPAYERFQVEDKKEEIPEWMHSQAEKPPSHVELVPPVSVPPANLSSTLGNTPGETADLLSSSRPEPPHRSAQVPTASTHLTVAPPTYSSLDGSSSMGSEFIKKSSLVPCTCTRHSMGCGLHSGSSRASIVPGDMDNSQSTSKDTLSAPERAINKLSRAENQFNIMKPFNEAFPADQGNVQGFLNSFSAFTR